MYVGGSSLIVGCVTTAVEGSDDSMQGSGGDIGDGDIGDDVDGDDDGCDGMNDSVTGRLDAALELIVCSFKFFFIFMFLAPPLLYCLFFFKLLVSVLTGAGGAMLLVPATTSCAVGCAPTASAALSVRTFRFGWSSRSSLSRRARFLAASSISIPSMRSKSGA